MATVTADIADLVSNVKHDEAKVWIDGVKGFTPAEYADSVHGSEARICEYLGESLTYADLICYSGFAFRVGVHDAMCPSAGHPCCGYQCLDNGFRAMPWKMKLHESFPWSDAREDRAAFEKEVCGAVKASIDCGVPVHYGGEEDGLIIGCGDEGRRWWCVHPYHSGGGTEPFWHDEATGFAGGGNGRGRSWCGRGRRQRRIARTGASCWLRR